MEEREAMLIQRIDTLSKEVNDNRKVIQEIRSRIAYYVGALVLVGFLISVFGRFIVTYALQ